MKKITALTILILSFATSSGAGRGVGMTLNDCLLYAREHAFASRVSKVRDAMAETDVRLSASSLMPSIDASIGGNISFGRNIDPETNTYDTRKTISNSYGLTMWLPVFDGLVSINNLRAAKVARRRQLHSSQAEEDRRSIEVIKSFYNVSYSKALVRQMRMQLSRDSVTLAAVMREFDLGTKSGADVAEMKAVVASDEFELTNQQNNLRKAYLSLKGNLGMKLDDADPELMDEDDTSFEDSGAENPRITAARLALRESQIRVSIAKGGFFPTISLGGGVSTSFYRLLGDRYSSPDFGRQLKDNMGEYIGVSLSFPIFRGLSRINSLKKARLCEIESRLEMEQTIYEVERETADALLDMEASEEEYEAAVRRLEAEEEAYKAVNRKFELGSASAIDLFTAGARLASARAGKEGKRIQRIISGILLSYYRGAKLILD